MIDAMWRGMPGGFQRGIPGEAGKVGLGGRKPAKMAGGAAVFAPNGAHAEASCLAVGTKTKDLRREWCARDIIIPLQIADWRCARSQSCSKRGNSQHETLVCVSGPSPGGLVPWWQPAVVRATWHQGASRLVVASPAG